MPCPACNSSDRTGHDELDERRDMTFLLRRAVSSPIRIQALGLYVRDTLALRQVPPRDSMHERLIESADLQARIAGLCDIREIDDA